MISKIPAHPHAHILLHDLHLSIRSGQTLHLSTHQHSGEKTGHRCLWSIMYLWLTLLFNSQDSVSHHMCSLVGYFQLSLLPTCTNGAAQRRSYHVKPLLMQLVTDHEPHSWLVLVKKVNRCFCDPVAGEYGFYEINKNMKFSVIIAN